jgi:shikimate kinase
MDYSLNGGQRLFLIGPMGAGKTTVGKRLADALELTFVDSDAEIEQRTGVSIPTIFDIEGEQGFRTREEQAIDELSWRERIVLATGGGAVLSAATRERLRARGTVIFLDASVEQQLRRTRHDRNRPLLRTSDPKARLQQLLEQRLPLYRETADLRFTSDNGSPRRLVQRILNGLNNPIHPKDTQPS